ncbi:class I SAM-dependent methyltransferase [Variovorax sp. J22P168]|uniref:class I SAM-dependent methyltransferase n=1 Tax=Variovorax jilinensis TaxID=3053513 RepID=UPI002578503E|nr:class I SAM-dependent methyltransferase [Variovorax sp. J22P168]MDM0012841.1 class I SAM-dependent methyltransferase [Variovorax sp. J22P168]
MHSSTTTTATVPRDAGAEAPRAFPLASVEHLQALAFLFGLDAPSPAGARVLELGCGGGDNLIPFAARHPQARAVGIDPDPARLRAGAGLIARARLMNIELRAIAIEDIDAAFGEFDYIVCHDVYSGVAPAVQQAILRVCARNLAPDGVAFVSYKVYPGWKSREIVRDAMNLRGAPRDEPDEKLAYARGMLDFLDRHAPAGSVLKRALEANLPLVRGASSDWLLQEFLQPAHAPCYFKEFVARADAEGLTYLADAEPQTMFARNHGERLRESLMRECGASQIMMEQTLDFLVDRTHRQSLLVKRERAPGIRWRLDLERIRGLDFAGSFAAEDGSPLAMTGGGQACRTPGGQSLVLRLPVHRAVALALEEIFPATMKVDALLAEVAARTGESRTALEAPVLAMLEELLILGAVRIRRSPPRVAATVSALPEAPAALRTARAVALSAGPSATVTNQWHEPVALSPLERVLLPLLDGRHSHDDLARHLAGEATAGRLRLIRDDKPLTDEDALLAFARQQVGFALRDLRRKALLAG